MAIKAKKGTVSDDTLNGTDKADLLYGLAGNDYLIGGKGADALIGGDGDDTLEGGSGADKLIGGLGNDTFIFNQDYLTLTGGAGNDSYLSYYNSDYITDFSIGDKVDLSSIDTGMRQFIGDAEFNGIAGEARYENNQLQFDVDGDASPDAGIGFYGEKQVLIVEEIKDSGIFVALENVQIGGSGADTLYGNFSGESLTGNAGTDMFMFSNVSLGYRTSTITDFEKGDQIVIDMPEVPLKFVGDSPFGKLAGEYRVEKNYSPTQIQFDFDGDGQQDGTIQFSNMMNSYANPTVGAISQKAGKPNTLILVSNQLIDGKKTNDKLTGDAGNDTLNGFEGNDTLDGGKGNDSLSGGAGDDVLISGGGMDALTGGIGKDLFKISNPSLNLSAGYPEQIVSITDFKKVEKDKIDLSAIDAITQMKGDQSFTFIGQNDYSGTAGELRVGGKLINGSYFNPGSIYADVNGDKVDDFSISITGSYDYGIDGAIISLLTAADFVL